MWFLPLNHHQASVCGNFRLNRTMGTPMTLPGFGFICKQNIIKRLRLPFLFFLVTNCRVVVEHAVVRAQAIADIKVHGTGKHVACRYHRVSYIHPQKATGASEPYCLFVMISHVPPDILPNLPLQGTAPVVYPLFACARSQGDIVSF